MLIAALLYIMTWTSVTMLEFVAETHRRGLVCAPHRAVFFGSRCHEFGVIISYRYVFALFMDREVSTVLWQDPPAVQTRGHPQPWALLYWEVNVLYWNAFETSLLALASLSLAEPYRDAIRRPVRSNAFWTLAWFPTLPHVIGPSFNDLFPSLPISN